MAELDPSEDTQIEPRDVTIEYVAGPWKRAAIASVLFVGVATVLYITGRWFGLAPYYAICIALPAAAAVARFLPMPHRVVVRDDELRIGSRTIRYDDIVRIERPPYRFATDQVALSLKPPEKPSLWWHLFGVTAVPLRGDQFFIAKLIQELHRRRRHLPVEAGVYEVIGSKKEGEQALSIATVISFALLSVSWFIVLSASLIRFAAPSMFLALPLVFGLFAFSGRVTERDSARKATLLAVFAGATPATLAVWLVALLEGYMQYLPVVYGMAGIVSLAGVAAMFPLTQIKRFVWVMVAAVTAIFLVTMFLLSRAGTITVHRLSVWPPPYRVSFSPEGRHVFVEGAYQGRRLGAVIDVKPAIVTDVPQGSRYMSLVLALGEDQGIFLRREFGDKVAFSIGSADGDSHDLYSAEGDLIGPAAACRDNMKLAFFVAEGASDADGVVAFDDRPKRLMTADLERKKVTITDVVVPEGASVSVGWSRAGLLTWAEHAPAEQTDDGDGEEDGDVTPWRGGPLTIRSWTPSDEQPQVEFSSERVWRSYSHSPHFDVIRATAGPGVGPRTRLIRMRDDKTFDVPGTLATEDWSDDGSVYAYATEESRQLAMMINTDTLKPRVLYETPLGNVAWIKLSPDGARAAVCIHHTSSDTMGIVVVDIPTHQAVRLLPIVFDRGSLADGGPRRAAWSYDSTSLAVATSYHPLATSISQRRGEVWIVSFE